jgi:hypothetical protein
MKVSHWRASQWRAGLSVLEVSVSIGALGVIGYGLVAVMDFGLRSQQTVTAIAANNSHRQEATAQLTRELSSSSDDRITIAELPGGNTALTFQQPIEVNGIATWGVSDDRLALSLDEEETFEGWSLCYTVLTDHSWGPGSPLSPGLAQEDPAGGANVQRTLVRQVLDDQQQVVSTHSVLNNLRGQTDKPGFRVQRVGDVWEISIATLPSNHNEPSLDTVIHVVARN